MTLVFFWFAWAVYLSIWPALSEGGFLSCCLSSENAPPQTWSPWSSHCCPDRHWACFSASSELPPYSCSGPWARSEPPNCCSRHVHQGAPRACLSAFQEPALSFTSSLPGLPSPSNTFGFKAPEQFSRLLEEPTSAAATMKTVRGRSARCTPLSCHTCVPTNSVLTCRMGIISHLAQK